MSARAEALYNACLKINAKGKVFVTTHKGRNGSGILIIASVDLELCTINEPEIPESIQTAQDFEEYIEAEMAIRLLKGPETLTPRAP